MKKIDFLLYSVMANCKADLWSANPKSCLIRRIAPIYYRDRPHWRCMRRKHASANYCRSFTRSPFKQSVIIYSSNTSHYLSEPRVHYDDSAIYRWASNWLFPHILVYSFIVHKYYLSFPYLVFRIYFLLDPSYYFFLLYTGMQGSLFIPII